MLKTFRSGDSKIDLLRKRSALLATARAFFAQRSLLEVDCPALSPAASVDTHIDLFPVQLGEKWGYLHTSPEYGMKRLLSQGIGDIYQISHVFRMGEFSKRHNPEFTLVEWYRLGFSFEQLIGETLAFIQEIVGKARETWISYREAFQIYAGIDIARASDAELLACLAKHDVRGYPSLVHEGRDAILNLILGCIIEPAFPRDTLIALTYYPASQAALARTVIQDGFQVAERFEVYLGGLELANGYHELADAEEQRQRLQEHNVERVQLGKEALPMDENFLQALQEGLPDCCGVAVGFDRLVMLRMGCENIADVLPFGWATA